MYSESVTVFFLLRLACTFVYTESVTVVFLRLVSVYFCVHRKCDCVVVFGVFVFLSVNEPAPADPKQGEWF